MTATRRRYTMYPQKTFAGYVETEILADGKIQYFLFFDGMVEPNEFTVDPADEDQMRAVRQLHMVLYGSDAKSAGNAADPTYMIADDDIETVLASIEHMFRKVSAHAEPATLRPELHIVESDPARSGAPKPAATEAKAQRRLAA